MSTLKIRKSHKYVGSYQHEDEWECIGSYEVTYTERWVREDEEPDYLESNKVIYNVSVESEAPAEEVMKALKDDFTLVGCHHEYDCCGCRSYHAKKPIQISDSHWLVEVNSWRNF